MSLINQVLRDLDKREPLAETPTANSPQAVPETAKPATDWVRLMSWTLVGAALLIVASYWWIVERNLPTTTTFKPAQVRPVPVSQPLSQPLSQPAPADEAVAQQAQDEQPTEPPTQELVQVQQAAVETQSLASVAAESPQPATEVTSEAGTNTIDAPVADAAMQKAAMQERTVQEPLVEPVEEVAYLPLKISEPEQPVVVERNKDVKPVRQSQPKSQATSLEITPAKLSPLAEAKKQLGAGRLTEAEAGLRAILAEQASALAARELLAGLLVRSDRLEEAEALVDKGLDFYPNRENLVLMKAQFLLSAKRQAEATALLESKLAAKPRSWKLLAMLAPIYQQQSRFADSDALYQRLVSLQPGQATHWLGLAISREALNKPADAVQAYQQALQLGNLEVALQQYARQRLAAINNDLPPGAEQ